jgi:hypothetical protein
MTWRLGCALRFLLSFLVGARFARLRGCQTDASFAWARTEGVTAEILEELPPAEGFPTNAASWRWRELPGMSVARSGCGGCVLSDGCFAVFGGMTDFATRAFTTACEVLSLGGDNAQWEPLPPMHEARFGAACERGGWRVRRCRRR